MIDLALVECRKLLQCGFGGACVACRIGGTRQVIEDFRITVFHDGGGSEGAFGFIKLALVHVGQALVIERKHAGGIELVGQFITLFGQGELLRIPVQRHQVVGERIHELQAGVAQVQA